VRAGGASLPAALTDGYHLAFTVGAGTAAVGALVALLVVRAPRARDEIAVLDAEIAAA
jgi:hypothetical protein